MIKIDGNSLANDKIQDIKKIIATLENKPHLVIISVSEDKASEIYVNKKLSLAKDVGCIATHHKLSDCSQDELHAVLDTHSEDPNVHGIILQLPLANNLDINQALLHINPLKDVDCLNPENIGKLCTGQNIIAPCTPSAILQLLEHYDIKIDGKNIVIFGRSLIVGLPLSIILIRQGATVTVCNSKTKDRKHIVSKADIVISATGKMDVFEAQDMKKNSVLIDVGIIRDQKGIRGDISPSKLKDLYAYTPVPFGVGPMTVYCVIENTLKLYQHANNKVIK